MMGAAAKLLLCTSVLLAAFCLLPQAEAKHKCYEASMVRNEKDATKEDCTNHEKYCFWSKKDSDEANTRYNMGCADKDWCKNAAGGKEGCKTVDKTTTCCCKKDKCNKDKETIDKSIGKEDDKESDLIKCYDNGGGSKDAAEIGQERTCPKEEGKYCAWVKTGEGTYYTSCMEKKSCEDLGAKKKCGPRKGGGEICCCKKDKCNADKATALAAGASELVGKKNTFVTFMTVIFMTKTMF